MQEELKKQHNQELLDAIYKNSQMGINGIKNIIDAVEDGSLKHLLSKQQDKYIEISQLCSQKALQNEIEIKDVNPFLKGMSYTSIKMKSMMDNSTSHLADMLVQGTTMGVTDTLKKQSENSLANEDIIELAKDLQRAEEEFVDSLKKFLVK